MEITFDQYKEALLIVNAYLKEQEKVKTITIDTNFYDIPMSVRLYNCLKNYFGDRPTFIRRKHTASDLQHVSLDEFKYYRNVGVKTIDELINIASSIGIQLKP